LHHWRMHQCSKEPLFEVPEELHCVVHVIMC
jgi:hypothetical protein